MRARMALHISGIDYEHREVLLRDKPAQMLAASAKGTVPVFVKDTGEVIDESLEIALWALSRHDPQGWLDGYDAALTALNDGPFKTHLDRYKYASRYEESAKRGDVNLGHRREAEIILNQLNQRLERHSYLTGSAQNFTDISVFPFIRQFAAVEPKWWNSADFTALRDWLTRHVESGVFKTIMTKHPRWAPSAAQS